MVVGVMTNIKRKIAINSLKRTGAVQAAGAAGADAAPDGIFRKMLDDMTSAAARKPGLVVPPCLPQIGDVAQPEMTGFNVDGALPDMVLDVRVGHLLLGLYIFEGKIGGCFRRPEKGRRVIPNKTRLPAVGEILAGPPNDVFIGNECPVELNDMAGGCSHANGVPP